MAKKWSEIKRKSAPLTEAQIARRRLVEAPLQALGVRRIPSQATWAGVTYQELDIFFEGIFRKRGPQEFDEPSYEPDWDGDEEELEAESWAS